MPQLAAGSHDVTAPVGLHSCGQEGPILIYQFAESEIEEVHFSLLAFFTIYSRI